MTMQQTSSPAFRAISDITPKELQGYLDEARNLRSQAFAGICRAAGRFVARPFRRGDRLPEGLASSTR